MRGDHDADVVVIGSGVSGLTTAAYLGALGRDVLVLERDDRPGGNLAAYARDGYQWDIGLDYLGVSAQAQPAVKDYLQPLGIDVAFRELDPDSTEALVFEEETFRVPKGVEAFRGRLHEWFPRERRAIDRFLRRLVTVGEELQTPLPSALREGPGYAWRTRRALLAAGSTLGHELDRLDCSPRLRVVLSWKHGGSGVAPHRISFGEYALACLTHGLGGLWYPEGGGQTLVDGLLAVIRGQGGRVETSAEVCKILVEDRAVQGVVVRSAVDRDPGARRVRAPVVVASGDLKATALRLLSLADGPRGLRRRAARYEMAASAVVLYLILDRDLRAEGWGSTGWWHVVDCDDLDGMYESLRHDRLPAQQWTGITSQSLKDPTNQRLCGPGQTNLRLMTFGPGSHEFWDVGPDLVPGPGYDQRARYLRDRMVRHAQRAIPDLADSIAYEHVATPITHQRHFGTTAGSPYGIAATPSQFGLRRPGPRTSLPGLYLTGASTRSMHGITGGMMGGAQTASAVAGADVVDALEARSASSRRGRP